MTHRPQVLLSAYQCGPGEGSVSQIGWEWYSRLAQHATVTLVTHVRNKRVLEAQPRPSPDAEVIYIDTEALAGPLYRAASRLFPRSQHAVFLISSLDFFAFDRQAVHLLRNLQRQGRAWDVVHCVTPVSPVASPTLHKLGLPVVLGPWNGGLKSPATFPEFMKQDSAWLYPLRNAGRVAEWVNRGVTNAARVLVATQATAEAIPPTYRHRCLPMLENAVDLERFAPTSWPAVPSPTNPLRVTFVGRLVPFKGVPMLLEAARNVAAHAPIEVSILGDGPQRATLEQQASRLGLSSMVRFTGNQEQAGVAKAMQQAHVFCLPSVRESGGAVLLEAMASARPVIAVRYGGPAELVTDEVGRALEPIGKDEVIQELTAALLSIVDNPEIWRRKGLAGRARAEREFSWDAKISHALSLYQDLILTAPHRKAPCSSLSSVTRSLDRIIEEA